jgi:hypothetical protein
LTKNDDIVQFYQNAKSTCIREGYGYEIKAVSKRNFNDASAGIFLHQYVYVVLNSGMKNQVAKRIFHRFWASQDLKVISHQGKRLAIASALRNYQKWFDELCKSDDKLAYLETLSWIGPITKYHLARNLGIDVAKPDRRLVRIARHFHFDDVQEMCRVLSEKTGDRIGVVDVVLWRASSLGLVKL